MYVKVQVQASGVLALFLCEKTPLSPYSLVLIARALQLRGWKCGGGWWGKLVIQPGSNRISLLGGKKFVVEKEVNKGRRSGPGPPGGFRQFSKEQPRDEVVLHCGFWQEALVWTCELVPQTRCNCESRSPKLAFRSAWQMIFPFEVSGCLNGIVRDQLPQGRVGFLSSAHHAPDDGLALRYTWR